MSLGLAVVWLAGAPSFFIPLNHAIEPLPIVTAERILWLLILVLLAVRLWRRRNLGPSLRALEWAMVAYVTVVVLSWLSTVADKDATTLKQDADFLASCFFMPATTFLVARSASWTVERLSMALWILVAGLGSYLIAVGFIQAGYDWNFLVAEEVRHIHPKRAKATFNNSLPYGLVLATLLFLTLFLRLQSSSRTVRLATTFIAVGLLECILFSKGRAVWLGTIVALAVMARGRPTLRRFILLLILVLVGQIFLLPRVAHLFPVWGTDRARIVAQFDRRLVETSPLQSRTAVYATAINMIRHNPLFGFGVGLSTFHREKSDYYASWGSVPPQRAAGPFVPHNEILNVLVLMGVAGLIPFAFLAGAVWQRLAGSQDQQDASHAWVPDLVLTLRASFILLALFSVTHDLMYVSYVQLLFWFLLGIVSSVTAHRGPKT